MAHVGDPSQAQEVDDSRFGYVHSAETTSGVNGPGLRYTVFFAGCPLRCLYCHNPDTQVVRWGERTTARKVIREAGRYQAFLRNGGGLTVTGGEPLMQPTFLEAIFVGVKAEYGMHTTLDTSAHGGHRASENLLNHTDLVLLDIKAGNHKLYERVSGGGRFQNVLDFADRLVDHQIHMWVRFVLVPGLTDDPKDIAEVADLAADFGKIVDRVEVLPYHRLGEEKYAALGRAYPLLNTVPPTNECVEEALEIFRSRGLLAIA